MHTLRAAVLYHHLLLGSLCSLWQIMASPKLSCKGRYAEGFHAAIFRFALVILVAAPLFALAEFVEQRLVLEWRRYLTRQLLKGYYSNQAFFRLHQQLGLLDNPDQARRLLCPGGPQAVGLLPCTPRACLVCAF